MKTLLERQHAFYEDHGRYSDDLDELGIFPWESFELRVDLVGDSAWTARVHHVLFEDSATGIPDNDCVTYWGPVAEVPRTIMRGRAPDGAGDRICDLTPSTNPVIRRIEGMFPPFNTERTRR